MPGREGHGVSPDVVDVHPDPVAEAVDEVGVAGPGAAEVAGVVLHVLPGNLGQLADGDSGPDRIHRRLLGAEDQVVDRPLAGVKRAGGRDRAGHIGGVVPELGPHVHDDEVAVRELRPVLVVVEHGPVHAGAHDARVAQPLRAEPPEGALRCGLELVLPGARRGRLMAATCPSAEISTARRSRRSRRRPSRAGAQPGAAAGSRAGRRTPMQLLEERRLRTATGAA